MSKRLRVTAETIKHGWGHCYSLDEIKRLFGRRKYVDAEYVLRHPDIPAADKLWCVLREEMIPAPILHEFGLWNGKRALLNQRRRGAEPHPALWAVLRVKRRWLQGRATDKELSAAEAMAKAVGDKAAEGAKWTDRSVAWAVAWAVAKVGSEEVAWTARSVAWAVAEVAARVVGEEVEEEVRDRAEEAAEKRQCAKLLRMVTGDEG